MNKKVAAITRYITLTLALLAALGFAACGETFSGQNTFLTAEAGEVEISGTAVKRIEYEISSSIDYSGLKGLNKATNISYATENLTIIKHTGGEGSYTFNLVLKKDDKVLSLPLSATYGYTRYEENEVEYRDLIDSYLGVPYVGYLLDGRLVICSCDGVFLIDPNTLAYEKLEFGRLPIDAPFVIKGVQLGYDGKFTLLATDKKHFDYIVKLDENKKVDGYKKIELNYVYLYGDARARLLFGKLVAADDSYEYLFNTSSYGFGNFYFDGETDKYIKLMQRIVNERGEYDAAAKMAIYRASEEFGFESSVAVATYDNGETIRLVKFDASRLEGAFLTHIYKPRYTYEQDVATYYLAPDFAEVAVNFASNTASIEYNFTKDMLSPAPFAISADGRYELYAANYTPQAAWQTTHVVMYDTQKKEITYLSTWLDGACPTGGYAGFFKNDDIYLQQGSNLLVFSPGTAQKGAAVSLNLFSDFGRNSLIHTFRRDPDDKTFVVVYSRPSANAPAVYSMAFYGADGKLTNNIMGTINTVYDNYEYVELSVAVSGKTYIVKGYDSNDKLVVHFTYTVGDTSITRRL